MSIDGYKSPGSIRAHANNQRVYSLANNVEAVVNIRLPPIVPFRGFVGTGISWILVNQRQLDFPSLQHFDTADRTAAQEFYLINFFASLWRCSWHSIYLLVQLDGP